MAQGNDGYAPISLPHDCDVLPPYGSRVAFDQLKETSDSAIPEDMQNLPDRLLNDLRDETDALIRNVASLDRPAGGLDRRALVELVQDTVWWRRLLYFVSLGLALAVVAYPLIYSYLYGSDIAGLFNKATGGFFDFAVGLARGFLPTVAEPWLTAFVKNPAVAILIVSALVSSLWCSRFLQRRIRDRAREAWGVRAIVDGRELEHRRLIEQRQAPLVAAIMFTGLLVLAWWARSKTSFFVALGGALLSSVIFWVLRAGRDTESNNAAQLSILGRVDVNCFDRFMTRSNDEAVLNALRSLAEIKCCKSLLCYARQFRGVQAEYLGDVLLIKVLRFVPSLITTGFPGAFGAGSNW